MAIEWPKEWDDGIEDDWPATTGATGLQNEPRLWSAFQQAFQKHDVRFVDLVERMGGPAKAASRSDRALDEAKAAVLAYHKEHGRRPTQKTSPEWSRWQHWLRNRGSSLPQLCDGLGLPGKQRLDRTLDEARAEVLAYHKEHGERPTVKTSPEWKRWNNWLVRQRSSLRQFCDELKLPGGPRLDRTIEEAKSAVLAHYKEHGERPSMTTNSEWKKWGSWLSRQGSSLPQLCDELGLPGGYRLDRTMEEAKAEVLAYHNEHGRRPSQETNPEWNQWHQWLRARGKSLSQLCDELGLARAVKAA